MGKHKSPFSEEVAEEWDQLVLDKGAKLSLQERRERWRKLYEKHFVDGVWLVHADDAGLIVGLGIHTAFEAGEYSLIGVLADQFFAHPTLDPAHDRVNILHFEAWRAAADFIVGDPKKGAARLTVMMHSKDYSPSEAQMHARTGLGIALDTTPATPATQEVRMLAEEVIRSFPDCEEAAGRVKEAATYKDLNALLMETFPNYRARR